MPHRAGAGHLADIALQWFGCAVWVFGSAQDLDGLGVRGVWRCCGRGDWSREAGAEHSADIVFGVVRVLPYEFVAAPSTLTDRESVVASSVGPPRSWRRARGGHCVRGCSGQPLQSARALSTLTDWESVVVGAAAVLGLGPMELLPSTRRTLCPHLFGTAVSVGGSAQHLGGPGVRGCWGCPGCGPCPPRSWSRAQADIAFAVVWVSCLSSGQPPAPRRTGSP